MVDRRRLLIAVPAFLVGRAWAQDTSASQSHADHGAGGTQQAGKGRRAALGSSAAVDASGAIWAVHLADDRLVIRRSGGAGTQWSAPIALTDPGERVEADGDSRPKVATGPSGEIYVTWTHPLGKPYTGEIRFSRSVDGGRRFSAPVTVHRDAQQITLRFDAVTVTPAGQVVVAWIDRRDAVQARAEGLPEYRGAAVYFAVSDDHGASFRGDFKVADHSCECCRIALLPRADGSVDALWRHVFEPNIRDHALATLRPDGTATVPRRATFDDWRIDACPHHGPSLVSDGAGTLHAVWFAQASTGGGAFYGRLVEGRVDGQRGLGVAAEHPDLLAVGRRVIVAWKEFDGTQSRLRAEVSEDSGLTWSVRDLGATDDASGQPQLLRTGDGVQVFWNTRASGPTLYPVV